MSLSDAIGRGLLAGLAGTAAMTVSSTVEAKLRGRPFSHAPADATAKALGIAGFSSDAAYERFSNLSHWGYGTGWGVVRGLLAERGASPAMATAAHGAAVWGNAQVALPVLDVAPPAWLWPRKEVLIDLFHHAVYALATGLAYERLTR
jgi:uncharacterized membrane protein YagU involved in acid resistance